MVSAASARDRAPEAAAGQGPARAVRADQRAGQAAHRPARAAAGRARGDRGRGRGGGRSCQGEGRHGRGGACPAEARPAAAAGASAARAGRRPAAHDLPLLRRQPARQDRRGRHRDPRRRPAPLVRAADRAREVHLPGLRDDLRAAGAVPRHPARPDRRQPAGDDPVREVRRPSAAQPPERALRPRRRRSRPLDAWPTMSAPARPPWPRSTS